LEQTSQSQALFFRGSWIADYPDAENYLGVFYGNNPAPPNYTRYNNPLFNQLYEKAIAETNDSLRYQLYQKMDQLINHNRLNLLIIMVLLEEVLSLLGMNIKLKLEKKFMMLQQELMFGLQK
jgi:peptide/nickel transport system substrate-binding protein